MVVALLVALFRALREPGQSERFDQDPDGFLAEHGLGSCTPAELAEAFPLAVAELAPTEAAMVIERCGPPEAWGTQSVAEVLVRVVHEPAVSEPSWVAPDRVDPTEVAEIPDEAVVDEVPVDEVPGDDEPIDEDQPVDDAPPADDEPIDENEPVDEIPPADDDPPADDQPIDENEPVDEIPPADDDPPADDEPIDENEPVDEIPPADDEPIDEDQPVDEVPPADDQPIDENEPVDEVPGDEPNLGEPQAEPLDFKAALEAARRAVADGDPDALVAAIEAADPEGRAELVAVIRAELALEGVVDDDPLVDALDRVVAPSSDASVPGDPVDDAADQELVAVVEPVDGAGASVDELPSPELVAKVGQLLRDGDVASAEALLDTVSDGEALRVLREVGRTSDLDDPTRELIVELELERSGFGEGELIGRDPAPAVPPPAPEVDDTEPVDPPASVDDPDAGRVGPPLPGVEDIGDGASQTITVGEDDPLGEEPAERGRSGFDLLPDGDSSGDATVGGDDFFTPPPPPPESGSNTGGLTPEELLELERISLEAGDDIIDNIGS
ncbi:MAG TPA: hypothetical protein VK866_05010 [Acidimicrobiales bacterium]|nr:hypothetical protein [Acidimicrobiales bacterium]